MTSELQRLNDPNYAISLAVGPPFPELQTQSPGSGLVLSGSYSREPRRFIFKQAHLSRDDFRILDGSSGHVLGEWDSVCAVSGYNGMQSLKIRPKAVSRHGRQNVYDWSGQRLLFNIGKESKLKNLALRSNLAVRIGDSKETVYRILPDLMGRTFQAVNTREELVCFVQKSTKALILEAALGAGSEMLIDVAPGVDWPAMVAVVMALQQVGAHFVKDALGNFVIDPLKGQAVQEVLQGTGMTGAGAEMGASVDQAMVFMSKMQAIHRMFVA